MTVLYVETASQLTELCEQLRGSQWLAVDTEFHREKTYHAQLCLIQIANDELVACVDPLAIENLEPLLDIFYQPDMTLVFHAARQDLELFYLLRKSLPQHIFDTQLAATVLGYGDQIGYGNLVKQCLDVDLDKAHSRTDWRQRPLSDGQVEYAADDVRYLRELYHLMDERLDSLHRKEWLQEDFAALSDNETYITHPEDSWRKVKGMGKLKGNQLAILQQLSSWREQVALQQNRPRKWIAKDEVLLDLARFAPKDIEKLSKVRGLENRDVDRYGQAMLEAIEAGKQMPAEQWPILSKPKPLTSQQDAVVDALIAVLRKSCDEQSITPIAVATRKDIESLVRGEDVALLHGWRHKIVGKQLKDFLEGNTQLRCDQNKLILE